MIFDTVIWDFNGTLVDDTKLGIDAANKMLRARGMREIAGVEEYRERFFFPVEEYYRSLGFDFEREPYKNLASEWFSLYMAGEPTILPMQGAKEALEMIKRAGLRQMILSASESVLLKSQLNRFGFTEYFDDIIGGNDFLAGGKVVAAKAKLGEDNHSCVMIGDTSHDFDTATAIGATPYLFSGGHESESRLSLTGAVISNSLTDICHMIISKNM